MQEFLSDLAEFCFGMNIEQAHNQKVCVVCKKKVSLAVLGERDKREYQISGVCPVCFDDMVKEE